MKEILDAKTFNEQYPRYKNDMEKALGDKVVDFEFGQFYIDDRGFDLTYNHRTDECTYASMIGDGVGVEFTIEKD